MSGVFASSGNRIKRFNRTQVKGEIDVASRAEVVLRIAPPKLGIPVRRWWCLGQVPISLRYRTMAPTPKISFWARLI